MTFAAAEFLVRAQLDRHTLDVWVEEGWLIPGGTQVEQLFYETDLARAHLIRDLIEDLGVNTEGVGIVLNLLDQLHGLRSALAQVVTTASDKSPT